MEIVMGVKSVLESRLEKARLFADSVRSAYEGAYNKATEMRKGGVVELVKDIQPKVRAAVEERLHDARAVLDELNQSLADKAIPSFRKGAVSKEKLDQKAAGAQADKNEAKPLTKPSKANAPRAKTPGAEAPRARTKPSARKAAVAKNKAVK